MCADYTYKWRSSYEGDSARPRSDFIYTKNSARPRSDFIYTKNSARPGSDYIYTKNSGGRGILAEISRKWLKKLGGRYDKNCDFQRRNLSSVGRILGTQI